MRRDRSDDMVDRLLWVEGEPKEGRASSLLFFASFSIHLDRLMGSFGFPEAPETLRLRWAGLDVAERVARQAWCEMRGAEKAERSIGLVNQLKVCVGERTSIHNFKQAAGHRRALPQPTDMRTICYC